jgi:RNA polymerase sigma-70 factor (ECF subfamily)
MQGGFCKSPPNTYMQQTARAKENWADHIRRIAGGDELGLMDLYDASGSFVYGLALRIAGNAADAEEVTADVFNQVWRRAADFDAEKGNPAAWLSVLTKSRAIDRYRSKLSRDRREETAFTPTFDVSDSSPLPEAGAILQQRRSAVHEALGNLRPDQKEALELSFFLGYTHSEVAERLGVPLGTVKSRVRTAMQSMRGHLESLSDNAGKETRR